MLLSVVIPVYNEEAVLPTLLDALRPELTPPGPSESFGMGKEHVHSNGLNLTIALRQCPTSARLEPVDSRDHLGLPTRRI